VSRPVLGALADSLELAADERAYLFSLADIAPRAPARRQPAEQRVDPVLQQLIDGMPDIPALILSRRLDVLAWNTAATALQADFAAIAPGERNLIRMIFLDSAYRSLFADWPGVARRCVAVLRREAGLHPDDVALTALVGELSLREPDFGIWWASHQVRGPHQVTKTYRHPVAGALTLDVRQLCVETQPDQILATYTARPGSPSEEALRCLPQWSGRTSDQDDVLAPNSGYHFDAGNTHA
jgi:hypothetical protein